MYKVLVLKTKQDKKNGKTWKTDSRSYKNVLSFKQYFLLQIIHSTYEKMHTILHFCIINLNICGRISAVCQG